MVSVQIRSRLSLTSECKGVIRRANALPEEPLEASNPQDRLELIRRAALECPQLGCANSTRL